MKILGYEYCIYKSIFSDSISIVFVYLNSLEITSLSKLQDKLVFICKIPDLIKSYVACQVRFSFNSYRT